MHEFNPSWLRIFYSKDKLAIYFVGTDLAKLSAKLQFLRIENPYQITTLHVSLNKPNKVQLMFQTFEHPKRKNVDILFSLHISEAKGINSSFE